MKIGLRIPGAAGEMSWADFCGWCKENGFEAIDVGAITAELAETVGDAGLTIGSADLPGVRDLLSVDSAKQEAGATMAKEAISVAAEHDVSIMFCVFVPEDASLGRAKNYEIWKETVPPIAEFAASKGVGIAVEGWPGGGPAYPALGCTPEMWREMFSECPDGLGLNYDPSHLVRISIDYLRALNESRPYKFIKIIPEKNLKINARLNAIKRCLINLIDNGLAYGQKVEIITKKTISDAVIFIDDNGPGIPEKEYQNVMKPFYRIDKSRGQNKSGVGLGLSITNDIIRSHGGSISLEKSPLSGLRVKIYLPL